MTRDPQFLFLQMRPILPFTLFKLYTAQDITTYINAYSALHHIIWTRNLELGPPHEIWIQLNIQLITTPADLSLNILKLNAFSIALEYCREAIFQSPPVVIIALNSSKLIRPSFNKTKTVIRTEQDTLQTAFDICLSYLIQINIV